VQRRTIVVGGKEARLLTQLQRGDDGDRKDAAKKLRDYDSPTVINALIEALRHDGESDVRKEAANSLGHLDARQALSTLRQAAHEDESGAVRKAAQKAIKSIESADGD
jgi:HEAT repeat protein